MSPSHRFVTGAVALATACIIAACSKGTETPEPTGHTVQINFAGAGQGQVTMAPVGSGSGNGCTSPTTTSCTASYPDATGDVTLTATASAGSVFAGWSGPCSGSAATCTVTMNQSHTINATFLVGNFLTVNIAGFGTVNASPVSEQGAGGACPGSTANACTNHYYPTAVLVTLTATPGADNVFSGWSGACTGTTNSCTVSMTQARSVTATFNVGHTLTVTMQGHGSVGISPPTEAGGGADCGNPTVVSCLAFYASSAQQVVLTATAPAGFNFEGWGGACTGTSQCVVTMNQNRAVDANWRPANGVGNVLSVNISGSGSVSFSPTPNSHPSGNCSNPATGSCAAIYTGTNQSVTLTATPTGAGTFVGWKGACTGTIPCNLTMSGGKNVVAVFSP